MAIAISPAAARARALPGGRAGYPRLHPQSIPPAGPRRADPARSCSVSGAAELAAGNAEGSGGRNCGSGPPVQAAQEMLALPSRGDKREVGGRSHQKGGGSGAAARLAVPSLGWKPENVFCRNFSSGHPFLESLGSQQVASNGTLGRKASTTTALQIRTALQVLGTRSH